MHGLIGFVGDLKLREIYTRDIHLSATFDDRFELEKIPIFMKVVDGALGVKQQNRVFGGNMKTILSILVFRLPQSDSFHCKHIIFTLRDIPQFCESRNVYIIIAVLPTVVWMGYGFPSWNRLAMIV